jgi:hypothetical protein
MPTMIGEQKPAQRFNTSLTVVLSKEGAHYVAETKNVSNTGLCLLPKEVFPVGSKLHLVFGQPPELPRLSTEGIVRWSDGGKGVGVEFTAISPSDRQALLKFLNSQSPCEQAEAAAPSPIKQS